MNHVPGWKVRIENLRQGDMIDMQPIYEGFGLTDTSEYFASQSELAVVETTTPASPVVGLAATLIHFENYPSFKLPSGQTVEVFR